MGGRHLLQVRDQLVHQAPGGPGSTVDGYTMPYPCIRVDGNKASIVPYMQQLCPHCNGTKLKNIAQLVTDLATVLVKSNVLEVKVASVAKTALNLDARLFISATA